ENDDDDEDDDDSTVSSTPTSAPTSSSSGTSVNTSDKKIKKNKVTKGGPGQTGVPLPAEDSPGAKKRGRKKKVEGGKALIPAHVPVSVGDKLRVLYGPSAKESKVTYEAKVLEVEEEGNAPMYYVHYLGWNTRYDEWIRRPRIAENITWSQNRARKGRAAATKELKEKKEKEKDSKKEDKEQITAQSTASPKASIGKRGRPPGSMRERRESERSEKSDTSCTSNVSGPSTRATRDRGPSQPDSPSSLDQRRTRHAITGTTESDSEDYESDVDTGSEKSRTRASSERRSTAISASSSASSTPTSEPTINNCSMDKTPKETQMKTQIVEVKEEEEEQEPCGKDIDLNAIMSEMKGLDKPIKKEEDRVLKETTPRLIPVLPATYTAAEKKSSESPVKQCLEALPKRITESPVKPIMQDATKLLSPKLESLEDDIYEFKEPEPFDFGEMRARKDVRIKTNIGVVASEEAEAESKDKKKMRPRKDIKEGESEKTESDSDTSPSPQKRLVLPRESPVKRSLPDSKENILVQSEGNITPDKKDTIAVTAIITPPGKVLLKRDTPLKVEPSVVSIPEAKIIKPEFSKSPSPKSSPADSSKSPSPLKEPIRFHMIPVKTKSIANIERPVASLSKAIGSPHLLTQAVMTVIESKALAKPVPKQTFDVKAEKSPLPTKTDEKADAKVIPFSQRQQHIFPHLLNRSENNEKLKDILPRVTTPYIQSPSIETVPTSESGSLSQSSSDIDRIKRESSVEESIEAVVKRARQDQDEQEELCKTDSKLSPDKKRRTSGRMKALSCQFVHDTSEESDSDSRLSRPDIERRSRRGRLYGEGEKLVRSLQKLVSDIERENARSKSEDL
ncbi:hypothetical protein OTU49_004052, partial [Cherax quadricarinatus]